MYTCILVTVSLKSKSEKQSHAIQVQKHRSSLNLFTLHVQCMWFSLLSSMWTFTYFLQIQVPVCFFHVRCRPNKSVLKTLNGKLMLRSLPFLVDVIWLTSPCLHQDLGRRHFPSSFVERTVTCSVVWYCRNLCPLLFFNFTRVCVPAVWIRGVCLWRVFGVALSLSRRQLATNAL